MTIGAHYLDETAIAAIVTIPIAAGSLAGWLEYVFTMIDNRINGRCFLSTNTTNTMDKNTLNTVAFNSFMKIMRNTRLSREGVPAEIEFTDTFFSQEDFIMMEDIRMKNKFAAKGYARSAVV